MSLEFVNTFESLRETMETPEFQAAQQFVRQLSSKLRDPAFRYQIGDRFARTNEHMPGIAKINAIGNFYESMGPERCAPNRPDALD